MDLHIFQLESGGAHRGRCQRDGILRMECVCVCVCAPVRVCKGGNWVGFTINEAVGEGENVAGERILQRVGCGI